MRRWAHERLEAGRPPLEPGHGLAVLPRRGPQGRSAGLQPPLGVGPPVRDLRRSRTSRSTRAGRAWRRPRWRRSRPASASSSAPTRSATRASWPSSPRRSTTSPAGARSSGSAAPGWSPSTRRTASSSARASGSGSTGSTRRWAPAGTCSTASRSPRRPAGTTSSTTCATHPTPVQAHLPIMIGGSGEKKTLRTVAKYADMWNGMGSSMSSPARCRSCGSTARTSGAIPSEIEFTLGVKVTIRDSEAEAVRVWRRRSSTTGRRSPTSRTTRRSGTGRPSSSPSGRRVPSSSASDTAITEQPAPVRHRDPRAVHRPGQAARRPRLTCLPNLR